MAISADSPNPPPAASSSAGKPPVLIIGAGVSGLLLAQHLKREGVPFRVFERDGDLATRGAGWGLTLHWSLAALQSLLPAGLAERICDESSVDRWADRRGELSRFPFFNLESGELKAQTPGAVKSARVRVTRERLRRLLAEGVDIEVRLALSFLILSYAKGRRAFHYPRKESSVHQTPFIDFSLSLSFFFLFSLSEPPSLILLSDFPLTHSFLQVGEISPRIHNQQRRHRQRHLRRWRIMHRHAVGGV